HLAQDHLAADHLLSRNQAGGRVADDRRFDLRLVDARLLHRGVNGFAPEVLEALVHPLPEAGHARAGDGYPAHIDLLFGPRVPVPAFILRPRRAVCHSAATRRRTSADDGFRRVNGQTLVAHANKSSPAFRSTTID